MKTLKLSFVLTILLTFMCFNYAKAGSSANVKVTGTLPVLNNVSTNGGNLSASISADNGQLSSTINPGFQSFTNNNSGVNVTFTIQAEASDNSTANAMDGTNNSSEGVVVLTNSEVKPASSAITDALGNNPQVAKNGNVIGYNLQFTGKQGNKDYNPVFNNSGTSATIKAPAGTTDFTVQISNDSSVLSNTYSSDYDLAGAYEATIYCTVSTP